MVLVGQNIRNCTSCPHMQFHTLHTKHRTVKTPAPDTVAAGGGQGPGRERSCCGRARLQTPAAFGWLGSPAAALLPRAVSAPRARRAEEQEQARTAAAGCARRSGRKTASSAPPLLRGAAAGAPWPGLGRGQGRRALASRSPLCPSPQSLQSSGARRGTYGVWLGPGEYLWSCANSFWP